MIRNIDRIDDIELGRGLRLAVFTFQINRDASFNWSVQFFIFKSQTFYFLLEMVPLYKQIFLLNNSELKIL